ncbi:MAG: Crp/Fnr family transcriptional regulator [Xanthobacteraceae bacterium]
MTALPTAGDLEIVRRINILRGLNPLMVERLIAPAGVMILREGETVFRQSDPANAFFIVIEGWVKLYRITMAGEEAVISLFGKGDSFAEAVAFTGQPYPATAETVSKARVVRIPASHVVQCIRTMPDIALAMIASTSQHLHNLVYQVEQLKAQTGVQRVAEFLVSLAPVDHGPCEIALPYDKVLIAGRLGLKPESLSRAFAKLKSLGVEVHASHVLVRDVAKLQDYANSDRISNLKTLARDHRTNPGQPGRAIRR